MALQLHIECQSIKSIVIRKLNKSSWFNQFSGVISFKKLETVKAVILSLFFPSFLIKKIFSFWTSNISYFFLVKGFGYIISSINLTIQFNWTFQLHRYFKVIQRSSRHHQRSEGIETYFHESAYKMTFRQVKFANLVSKQI